MYLAGDIGGTNGRLAVFEPTGSILPLAREDFTLSGEDGDYLRDMQNFKAAVFKLQQKHEITRVTLSVAGRFDLGHQTLLSGGGLKHWVGQPLADDFSRTMDMTVTLMNDAVAAAWGELLYGLKPDQDFWLIIWGTGVGGAILRVGKEGAVPVAVDFRSTTSSRQTRCPIAIGPMPSARWPTVFVHSCASSRRAWLYSVAV